MFEFMISVEWVASICGLGTRNFVSRLVRTKVQSKLSLDVYVQECNSCLCNKKMLDNELVVASGSLQNVAE